MKDIRILLTTGNSVWGVISKVIGSNVYENVISFKDENGNYSETLKDEFIGDNLFNGNSNWKDLLYWWKYCGNIYLWEKKLD